MITLAKFGWDSSEMILSGLIVETLGDSPPLNIFLEALLGINVVFSLWNCSNGWLNATISCSGYQKNRKCTCPCQIGSHVGERWVQSRIKGRTLHPWFFFSCAVLLTNPGNKAEFPSLEKDIVNSKEKPHLSHQNVKWEILSQIIP